MDSTKYRRNTTRLISTKLKEKNYPSKLIYKKKNWAIGDNEDPYIRQLVPFKEIREYDRAGRLVNVKRENDKQDPNFSYEIYMKSGVTTASAEKVELMHFPICKPEKIYSGVSDGNQEDGEITWIRFMFEPREDFEETKLGSIIIEQYHATQHTNLTDGKVDDGYTINWAKVDCSDYFSHMSKDNPNFKTKELVTDVRSVEISGVNDFDLTVEGNGGIATNGTKSTIYKHIILFEITCQNPKDDKVVLSDMCSITVNSELKPL